MVAGRGVAGSKKGCRRRLRERSHSRNPLTQPLFGGVWHVPHGVCGCLHGVCWRRHGRCLRLHGRWHGRCFAANAMANASGLARWQVPFAVVAGAQAFAQACAHASPKAFAQAFAQAFAGVYVPELQRRNSYSDFFCFDRRPYVRRTALISEYCSHRATNHEEHRSCSSRSRPVKKHGGQRVAGGRR